MDKRRNPSSKRTIFKFGDCSYAAMLVITVVDALGPENLDFWHLPGTRVILCRTRVGTGTRVLRKTGKKLIPT